MVAADGAGQQQQAAAETDAADVDTTAENFERQNQDVDIVEGEVSSRGGGGRGDSRGGGATGVRNGGGTGAGVADGKLEDETAVGSIHHILKTAFKELYGGGAGGDKEVGKAQSSATDAAGNRQSVSAGTSGGESDRRSSSSAAGTIAEGEETMAGHVYAA